MTLLQDGLIALLAAFGTVTLLWLEVTVLAERGDDLPAVLLLPFRGAAENMEYVVRSLELRRQRGGLHTPIVLVDVGLEVQARRRAELLTLDHPDVVVVKAAEISKYWE